MQSILILLTVAAVGLIALGWYRRTSVAEIARKLRIAGLAGACLATLYFAARGQIGFALAAVGGALWLLRELGSSLPFGGVGGASERRTTDHLDVAISRTDGRVRGRILKGFFAGRRIESLRAVELAHLWHDCRLTDQASAAIVEGLLDRQHPTWREDMARDDGGAPGQAAGDMSENEARAILGVEETATDDQIRKVHRELMQKLHPDRGGSNYLAAKINEAKARLLKQR